MQQSNRRVLLASLSSAVAALGLKASTDRAEARKPATITQSELRALLELEHTLDRKCLSLAHRLKAGAAVQPGPLTAELEKYAKLEEVSVECSGFYRDGIDIGPTKG